jgi:hypothetical protein
MGASPWKPPNLFVGSRHLISITRPVARENSVVIQAPPPAPGDTVPTAAPVSDQRPQERLIPPGADYAAQPQPGADHHRQCHPQRPTLRLDLDFIRLHLSQLQGSLLHEVLCTCWQCCPDLRNQSRTVRSFNPKTITMACTGQPYASSVTTNTNISLFFLIPYKAVPFVSLNVLPHTSHL